MNEQETEAALERFLAAYIEAALFSSNDESDEQGGDPLTDNYGLDDLAPETREAMRVECVAFLATLTPDGVLVDRLCSCARDFTSWDPIEHAGHDFWLTRNGHGCGFWDGDWPEPLASELTKLAEAAGERDLYVGDDDQIYQSPA